MKKMLIGTIVVLLLATLIMPISALAKQGGSGGSSTSGSSLSSGSGNGGMGTFGSEFNNRLQERREEFQAARMSLEQLRTQTRAALQVEWEKMYGLKLQIREQLRQMADMTVENTTPEERQALKVQLQTLRDECKEIHIYCLQIRKTARIERRAIVDSINDLRQGSLTTEEETNVETIVDDVI